MQWCHIQVHYVAVTALCFVKTAGTFALVAYQQSVTSTETLIFYFQHQSDSNLGVYVIDRYTHYALRFLERVNHDSKTTIGKFVSICIFY